MSRASKRLIGIAMLLAAGVVAVLPMRTFLAVDSCLDAGGSFDFETRTCDFERSHPFSRPLIASPVFVFGGIALALVGATFLVFSRRTSSEPDMRSNNSLERTR